MEIINVATLLSSLLSLRLMIVLLVIRNISCQLEKAVQPKEEFALSLWLITRTGWVYCERAGVYMDATEQRFNEDKCKKCYINLFEQHKLKPDNVSDSEIIKCSRNFGASILPSFTTTSNGQGPQQQVSPFNLFRQLNPLETVGVRAVSQNTSFRLERIIMPTVASMFQLFSSKEFSSNNHRQQQFPRKSYVECLFGKLFETELALCPTSPALRRCANENRKVDEDKIFSTNIPISYDF